MIRPAMNRTAAVSIEPLEPRRMLATYYVAPTGLDTNPGTSLALPFKTIQKAASVAVAGDTVLIREGVYRETVRPTNSGTSAAPIKFMPYNGESVTIDGSEPIAGWTLSSGNVYVADMAGNFFSAATPGDGVNLYDASVHNQSDQVFFDSQSMWLARWPNPPADLDLSRPVKAVTNAFISKTRASNWTTGVVVDDDIAAVPDANVVGAEVYFQPNNTSAWSWAFTGHVTAKSGGQITFKSRSDSGKDGGSTTYDAASRYFVFNKRELLDAPGEWFHDKSAGKLYFWAPGGVNPEGRVSAKKREFAFNLDSRSYITIEGIRLFACSITTDLAAGGDNIGYDAAGAVRYPWRNAALGLTQPPYNDAPSTGVVLDTLDVRYPTHYTDISGHFNNQWGQSSGIVLSGKNHVLRNSVIRYSAGNGVSMIGREHRVLNNVITDTNYMCTNLGGVHTGATDRGSSDHEIAFNTILKSGKHGMQLGCFYRTDVTDGSDWKGRIHHNDISQFAMQDADTGGMYLATASNFLRIDHNRVHDAAANVDNISGAGNYTVSGIYPDYGRNLVIDHNVIWNVEWGIHIQNQSGDAGNMLIYNNTIRVKRFSGAVGYGPFGVVKNAPGANHAGTVVRNNIISSSDNAPGYTAIDFATDNTINRIVSDNLLWNNVVGSPTDPKFTDAAAGDFTLRAGSAAIDVGASIPAYTRDGIVVPAFPDPLTGAADVGAHEFGQATWSAGASSMPRVRGTSWNDANGNGTRDTGEGVLAGRTIYLDRNDNGNLDMTEDRSTSATGLPKAIADNATTTSSLAVSGFTNAVARVTVSVYLTHTRMSDIILTLVHPDGTRVTLLNRRGGNGDNLGNSTTDVVFDDSAGSGITSGSPPWTSPSSTWRPESPLSALAGKSANGNWTLEVRDAASSQTGTLRRWSLRVVTVAEPSTVTDADGAYAFEFNTPQTVSVRQVLPADWYATVPAGAHVAEVAFGQETIRDFGSRQFARGDLNGDGVVNNQDIAPFVLALTNVSDFATQYPSVPLLATGDVNGDGVVNNQDIAPFVALLTGGRTAGDATPTSASRTPVRRAPSPVPAPSSDRVVNLVLRPEEI